MTLHSVPVVFRRGAHCNKQRKHDVVNVYNSLRSNTRFQTLRVGGGSPQYIDYVAELLNIGRNTVARILREARETNGKFTSDKFRRASTSLCEKDELGLFQEVRRWVIRENADGNPPTSKEATILINDLLKEAEIDPVSDRTVRKWLRESWGFKYARGVGKYVLREADNVKEYRDGVFLPRFIDTALNEGDLVVDLKCGQTIVCLDESYIQPGHGRNLGWLQTSKDRKRASTTGLVVILGAIYIHRGRDGTYKTGILPGSIQVWNSASSGYSRGRKSPSSVKEDYHGALNAELFEKWFETVCKTATKEFGTVCHILLDNSKNHLRQKNKAPGTNDRKSVLEKWLRTHNIKLPPAVGNKKGPSKTALFALVKKHKAQYVRHYTWDIARKNGKHHILKTPPYHLEFQPIEKIWAVVKNAFANLRKTKEQKKSIPWTIEKVQELFTTVVKDTTIMGAWNSTMEAVKFFRDMEEDSLTAWDDEDSDMEVEIESDSDTDDEYV